MKTLSDEDKLQIMNNVVEPLIKELSPDISVCHVTSLLKAYLNSDECVKDGPEIKAGIIYSAGAAVRLYDYLAAWYED